MSSQNLAGSLIKSTSYFIETSSSSIKLEVRLHLSHITLVLAVFCQCSSKHQPQMCQEKKLEIDGLEWSNVVKYRAMTEIAVRVDVTMTRECQPVPFPFLVFSLIKGTRCVDQDFETKGLLW